MLTPIFYAIQLDYITHTINLQPPKPYTMAKLPAGVLGPLIGQIGPIVGSSRNGVPYVKGEYKSRTKTISNRELANRKKFAVAQQFLKPLLHFVKTGWAGYSEKSYGFIAAKSHLLKNAMEGEPDNPIVNPTLIKVSHGNLGLPQGIVASKIGDDTLEFSWDTSSYSGYMYDQAMLLAYDIEQRRSFAITTGDFRHTGKSRMRIGTGYNCHLYFAFVAHDRSSQSDSVYLGEMSF